MTAAHTMTSPDMLEATRLTREGRLAEATALLQRLFRGEAADATAAGPARDAAAAPSAAPAPRLFDVAPETGAVAEAGPSPSPAGWLRGAGAGLRPAGGM